jgi:hypothetical protein
MTTTTVASTLVRSLARRVVAQRGGSASTSTLQGTRTATRRCMATTSSSSTTTSSPWAAYEMGPLDPIIGLNETYNKDDFPLKQIVGVGAYRDGAGKPYVLPSVRKAEKLLYDQNLVSSRWLSKWSSFGSLQYRRQKTKSSRCVQHSHQRILSMNTQKNTI